MGIIYAIKHSPSGRMYIGSSVRPKARRAQHFSDLRHGRHCNVYLQRSFTKHGEAEFEWVVLERSDSDLLGKEKKWIDEQQAADPKFGYNISKEPMAPMRGRKHTPETIAKLLNKKTKGENHPNAKIDEQVVAKIFELKRQGLTQTYISQELGVHQSNVSLILRGKAWKHLSHERHTEIISLNNTSGTTGVYYNKRDDKWVAEIIRFGKHHHLGGYCLKSDAVAARKAAEGRLSSATK